MSYDIYLRDPNTEEVIDLETPHDLRGGTYAIGDTRAWLNVTYNYSKHFYKVFGKKGVRTIYGMTGEKSISILKNAISQLKDDTTDNYWDSTEGNAKQALQNMLVLARACPNGVWDGD